MAHISIPARKGLVAAYCKKIMPSRTEEYVSALIFFCAWRSNLFEPK